MDVRKSYSEQGNVSPAVPEVTGSNNLSRLLSIVLIVASFTFIGYYALRAVNTVTADAAVKGKQFQAVFLTNGQVYFGKLTKTDSSYVVLKNIYYLQVQQQVQPTDKTSSASPQVSLAKLGGELHGPEDVMYISRSQVLFWENLKTDGKVAQAIADYVAQGKK